MAIQITKSELKLYKSNIPCECKQCKKIFGISKSDAYRVFKGTKNKNFCSRKCQGLFKTLISTKEIICKNCNNVITKPLSAISKNSFCSKSCAATYNNKHKTKGNRRSKLEMFLEKKLIEKYPNLEIHFNRKDAINSELDIYIPSLKLAFELNGIYHYEPIHGDKRLSQIQNNDNRKFQACLEKGIELCIIDTSKLSYFKETNAILFFNIIHSILCKKMEQAKGIEPL